MQHAALFVKFLKFGLLAWGGPVAQIGMLRQELVDKERWISSEKFNRALALYQALPGPEAHELCVYLGMVRGGKIGAVLAGLGFMLPGVVLITLLAWAYTVIGPAALLPWLIGLKPAVAAVIVRGLHRIALHTLHDKSLLTVGVVACGLTISGVHFAVVLGGSGVARALWAKGYKAWYFMVLAAGIAAAFAMCDAGVVSRDAVNAQSPSPLITEGLKAGLLSFGGAYTAIPFLRDAMVHTYPAITEAVFLDAIALVNLIPAPLVSFATFLGFMAAGVGGAALITAGIFLPSFLFTLLGHRYLERMMTYAPLHEFLDGVAAGVTGMLAVTAVSIGASVVENATAACVFLVTLGILYYWRSVLAVPLAMVVAGLTGILLSL